MSIGSIKPVPGSQHAGTSVDLPIPAKAGNASIEGPESTRANSAPGQSDAIAEARKVLEEERQAREKRCMEKVQKDLDEDNCVLNVYLERMPNGYFVPRVGVAAV